jgi:tight adherence protein B
MFDFIFQQLLGKTGTAALVAVIFFLYSFKNSEKLFTWFEDQTFGTRDYVLTKCELLFYEIEPIKVTYYLLGILFVPPVLAIGIFSLMG